jgi:N-acetylglucosamine-6-phosphate deacetylase
LKSNTVVVVPKFIDLQVNGYLGCDFSDPTLTEEAVIKASKGILRDGGCMGYVSIFEKIR